MCVCDAGVGVPGPAGPPGPPGAPGKFCTIFFNFWKWFIAADSAFVLRLT